jgi:hypothetical protein
MVSSIFRIAEQVQEEHPDRVIQVCIAAVLDCFGTVTKQLWYEGKQDGVVEVDGSLIFTFGKESPLIPAVDVNTDLYYIVIPSSSVALPGGYGINQVSYLKGQTFPFAMINAGSMSMWNSIKASVLGGRQTYFVEGTKMYFPKMTAANTQNILLKLVLGLTNVDVRAELNIPPDMINQIIAMVGQKFAGPVPEK